MAEAYLPAGWPEAVAPPGAEDWERSAAAEKAAELAERALRSEQF